MWKAERGGEVIYLFADIPFFSPGMTVHIDAHVNEALDDSEVVVFPADPQAQAESATSTLLGQVGVYDADNALSKTLPATLYRQFQELCAELNIPSANFDRLKPWLAAKSLYPLALARKGVRMADRLDRHIYRTAFNSEMSMSFLSKPQDQLEIFVNMEESTQVEYFRAMLFRIRQLPDQIGSLESAWRFSDAQAVERLILPLHQPFPEVYEAMVSELNNKWSDQLTLLAGRHGNVFAVIPIDHLVGEGNIRSRLSFAGFSVSPFPVRD